MKKPENLLRKIMNRLLSKQSTEIKASTNFYKKNQDNIPEVNSYISDYFNNLIAQYSSRKFFKFVFNKIKMPLSLAEAKSTKRFVDDINDKIGINYTKEIKRNKLTSYVEAKTLENANLITNMTQSRIKSAQTIVTDGINNGLHPTALEKDLQESLNIGKKRAKTIARDQVAKIESQVERKRSQQIGIDLYAWSSGKDDLTSGKPSGKYPNAKIKCWYIARQDTKYGKGIYSYKDGATYAGETNLHPGTAHINCRCVAISLIPHVNYDPVKKERI